ITILPIINLQEIVDVHNAYRRAVEPTASNMLKMSWSDAVARSAHGWTDQCNMTHGPPSSRMIDGMLPTITVSAFICSTLFIVHSVLRGFKNNSPIGHYTQVIIQLDFFIFFFASQIKVVSCVHPCPFLHFSGNFRGVPPYSLGDPCAACPDDCEDDLCTNPCPYINTFTNCDELKEMATCDNSVVSQWCPASCQCEDRIVPIARK
uniref:Cysteine-rich venom protein ENH1-like n=1 Tax=Sinocyclocheilus anshuiensis TaxID=1608454 RepID=A0A671RL21_9TELE